MQEFSDHAQVETTAAFSRLLYKAHYKGAVIRSLASAVMWLFSLAAFLTHLIHLDTFRGISLSVLFLIAITFPTLWLIRHSHSKRGLKSISLLINFLEIVGYTAIIYFLGGIKATYLTSIYAILITYVAISAPREMPYWVAFFCSLLFFLVVAAEFAGLLPHHHILPYVDPVTQDPIWTNQLLTCLVVTGLLLVVAIIASNTAGLLKKNKEQMRSQNQALQEQNTLLVEKEKALELAHQELERRVIERTAELREANERLQAEVKERQMAEQILKESEERYRLHFENVHDVIYSLDRDFVVRSVSPSVEKVLGYKPDDFLGKPISEVAIFSSSSIEQAMSDILRVFSGESIDSAVYEFITRDGTRRIGEVSGAPITRNGEIIGLTSVARDITERQQAEARVKESEAYLFSLINTRDESIWSIDRNYNYIIFNNFFRKAYLEIFQIELKRGLNALDILSPELRAFWKPKYDSALAGQRVIFEFFLPLRNRIHIYEVFLNPVITEDAISGVSALSIDITNRKHLEEERTKYSKLEATGILAAGIAHDFNNLLSIILGNLELARVPDQEKEAISKSLEAALKATLKSRGLTRQLITLARGGDPVKKTAFLGSLIQEETSLALRGSQVVPAFSIPADLWPVEVDEGQIGQVIRNLVLNAREAMTDGGMVSISLSNLELSRPLDLPLPPGDYLKIEISDQGCGIPEALLSKVFDPYFSTKQRGTQKGMGLGLTICYSIIQKHAGTINVDTRLGRGTTFQIFLPASRTARPVNPSGPKILPRPGRILLMDDEKMVRDLFSSMLGRLGYEVEAVENGEQAIKVFQAAEAEGRFFDTAILDLTVRGGLGGELTIRELLLINPSLKAIVCSGYDQDPVIQNYEQYGFKAALTKPFQISDLTECLTRIMGKA